eukprot:CAMPEP_0170395700 /NCGR_PEP_ID=MMETSP0117_2-20130122/21914_1 /TAXON_ID=400756 /ORGANISM="Durinskia baltica, Strain CSIRO CS-38" /LENGTH=301 /DNA_ID=CAMNT_0010652019 /DNA_START=19 /DNA_END=921 /DNA_ORIENTATION=+
MTAIEIDDRSVRFLNEKLPGLSVLNEDIMTFNWEKLAAEKGGKLNVVANLPYYITSQVLFGLADAHKVINKAVVTMQWEVGERVTAKPSTKDYGIPSVVFQLYGKTELNFKIPPKVFFPVPKVDSALVTIDFSKPHKRLHLVEPEHLRKVITLAFRQRRKMLRQSLKELLLRDGVILLLRDGVTLASEWAEYRPEQLKPSQFIDLTIDMYGEKGSETSNRALSSKIPSVAEPAPAEKEKEKEDNGKINLERQEEIELATLSAPSSSSKSITSRRVSVLRDMLLKKRRDIKNKDSVSASAEL